MANKVASELHTRILVKRSLIPPGSIIHAAYGRLRQIREVARLPFSRHLNLLLNAVKSRGQRPVHLYPLHAPTRAV